MKTYEMLYVLDRALADDAREALVKKKLAYPINYKNDGFYVLMTFEAEGSVVKELDRVSGLTAEVLRRVITAKD